MVCRGLDQMGARFVVLDIDEARVEELDLYDFHSGVPALAADARLPENLMAAGIAYKNCRGVIALTNDDEADLAAAIAVKLLNTRIPVLCRAMRPEVAANMESFGTDYIIKPVPRVRRAPGQCAASTSGHALLLRLTSVPGSAFIAPKPLPRGRWIVCGYGRFGREVEGAFVGTGLSMAIVDPDPPPGQSNRFVRGLGTEAPTLLEAGVKDAVGIVAGTDNDINNLSIAMTARALNPKLFVVMRQNLQANRALFRAFRGDMTMVPAQIIANECLALNFDAAARPLPQACH